MNKFFRKLKSVTVIILSVVAVFLLGTWLYMQQDKFGASPSKEDKKRYDHFFNFKDGKFQNISSTPMLTPNYSWTKLIKEQLFEIPLEAVPKQAIPSIKTDLKNLSAGEDVLVWFGHSSYFIQLDQKTYLIDPVFSGNASPIPGTNKAFEGTDIYQAEDLPKINFLIITHDHYDHLDYPTIINIKEKVDKIICGIGVGNHFKKWGYPSDKIIELNWYEKTKAGDDLTIHCEPARHFSGRGFSRNNTIWASFVIQSQTMTIYIGGDSGYDNHFADIGNKYPSIDFAILDNGQYNPAWRAVHCFPEDVIQAAKDLKAKRILPAHSSKFKMANHNWFDPLETITQLNQTENLNIATPKIGEPINLKDTAQTFEYWWRK